MVSMGIGRLDQPRRRPEVTQANSLFYRIRKTAKRGPAGLSLEPAHFLKTNLELLSDDPRGGSRPALQP